LTEQLTALFLELDKRKETLKAMEKFPETFKNASESAGKMFDELKARREAALDSDPQNRSSQTALAKALVTLRGHYAAMKLDQETINRQVAEYTKLWGQTERIEANSKRVLELRQEIERLDDSMGDSHTKATREYMDRIRTISEAQERGVIGAVRGAEMTKKAYNDMYASMLDRTTLFGRSMQEMFRDLERTVSRTLAQMTLKQKVSFRDLITAMAQQILEFAYQVALVQPMMKGLFGGMYTRNGADAGSGILEGGMMALAKFFGGGAALPDASSVHGPFGGFGDLGELGAGGSNPAAGMWMGEFASGGSFNVGGSGGVDSQLVAFAATPGERVDVTPPGGGGSGHGVTVVVNNSTGMEMGAEVRGGQDPGQVMVDLFFKQLGKNAGARQQLSQMLGRPRH
jgi:hypothetical protein